MWLLFHRNAKTKLVRDGQSFVETCPECGERATFREVEISAHYGVFFVDLVDDKERAFRCGACGDVFDLKDRGAVPAAPAAKSAAELEREAAQRERLRVLEERKRREAAEAKAVQIEDELAELKKRMGR